jgi:hypothetical protein
MNAETIRNPASVRSSRCHHRVMTEVDIDSDGASDGSCRQRLSGQFRYSKMRRSQKGPLAATRWHAVRQGWTLHREPGPVPGTNIPTEFNSSIADQKVFSVWSQYLWRRIEPIQFRLESKRQFLGSHESPYPMGFMPAVDAALTIRKLLLASQAGRAEPFGPLWHALCVAYRRRKGTGKKWSSPT